MTAPDGGIMGVRSLSDAKPIKTAGFELRDADLAVKSRYRDWRFVYYPESAKQK